MPASSTGSTASSTLTELPRPQPTPASGFHGTTRANWLPLRRPDPAGQTRRAQAAFSEACDLGPRLSPRTRAPEGRRPGAAPSPAAPPAKPSGAVPAAYTWLPKSHDRPAERGGQGCRKDTKSGGGGDNTKRCREDSRFHGIHAARFNRTGLCSGVSVVRMKSDQWPERSWQRRWIKPSAVDSHQ